MTGVFIRRKIFGVRCTGVTWRMPHDNEDRGWSYADTSQETPKGASKPHELGRVPDKSQREHGPADTLVLDSWPL